MKKFLARLAVVGLFAGFAAASYALPASAATSDDYTAYSGTTVDASEVAVSWVIDVEYSNYRIILAWSDIIAESAGGSSTLAAGASDAMFIQ